MSERRFDAGLDLLDRQVVDRRGESVGKVDDLELELPADGGPPRVTALLLGPQAQGPRIGGRLGRWMAAAGSTLSGTAVPYRIPFQLVARFDVSIHLSVEEHELPGAGRAEGWLKDHFIDRVPGGRRASG